MTLKYMKEGGAEMICVDQVTKRYGETTVLSDISMELCDGNIYGLVGRNGCGKTMLMKCISGFVRPTSGTITIDGKRLYQELDMPQDMGVIIENPGFIPHYSGYKNLKLLASVKHIIGRDRIVEYMKKLGLDARSRKHVSAYSLGMKQKLGIIQAVMEKPSLLILDEPMNGLDRDSVCLVRELLREIADEGTLILLASHNREDIEVLCDRVYYMDAGKLKDSIEK